MYRIRRYFQAGAVDLGRTGAITRFMAGFVPTALVLETGLPVLTIKIYDILTKEIFMPYIYEMI